MLLVAHREPLQPYVEYFERFISDIEEESKKLQREERMEQRQENGNFFHCFSTVSNCV